jgi:hypothetical protein
MLDTLTPKQAPVVAQMEVWNRTLDDAFLIDPDGRLINVPACGHAGPAPLRVDNAELRIDAGQIASFGNPGAGARQYLVIVSTGGDVISSNERPVALPICVGHLQGAPTS